MKFFNIVVIMIGCLLLLKCINKNKESQGLKGMVNLLDSFPSSCPYVTKDDKGNIVVSWVRFINDSSAIFCYAISEDEGKTFGATVLIPSSNNILPHSENLPKIVFKPSGEIMALWGSSNKTARNKYAGLIYYSQSFDQGRTWSPARKLVEDTSGYDQRYYDVELLPNGEAAIIWLDNRKSSGKDGSALYFAVTKNGNGFGGEKLISQPCCPCCRTDLFIDSKTNIHVLYRGIIRDSIRDMVHSVSTDGGKTFTGPSRISEDNWVINGCPHTGPAMTENKNGLHFSWFTAGREKGCYYNKSVTGGISFELPQMISPGGSHPQITTLGDDKLVLVWDETVLVNNIPYKRIGIQKRNVQGQVEGTAFITADTQMAAYPVVAPLKGNLAFVAYSVNKNNKSHIEYQILAWNGGWNKNLLTPSVTVSKQPAWKNRTRVVSCTNHKEG